jgi:hypothetical protein
MPRARSRSSSAARPQHSPGQHCRPLHAPRPGRTAARSGAAVRHRAGPARAAGVLRPPPWRPGPGTLSARRAARSNPPASARSPAPATNPRRSARPAPDHRTARPDGSPARSRDRHATRMSPFPPTVRPAGQAGRQRRRRVHRAAGKPAAGWGRRAGPPACHAASRESVRPRVPRPEERIDRHQLNQRPAMQVDRPRHDITTEPGQPGRQQQPAWGPPDAHQPSSQQYQPRDHVHSSHHTECHHQMLVWMRRQFGVPADCRATSLAGPEARWHLPVPASGQSAGR